MTPAESLAELVNGLNVVPTRAALAPHVPALQAAGPALWTAVCNRCSTRSVRYLFLNAPELWEEMTIARWLSVMTSGIDRSYRPPDVFDTARFDDLMVLNRYVGVDAFQMFFEMASPTPHDRAAVKQRVLGMTDFYLWDEADDELFAEHEVYATRETLRAYHDALRAQAPTLRAAAADAALVQSAVQAYAPDDSPQR